MTEIRAPVDRRELLEQARIAVREIERFCYREVSEACELQEVHQAKSMLRTTVGLRRMLDKWRNGDG